MTCGVAKGAVGPALVHASLGRQHTAVAIVRLTTASRAAHITVTVLASNLVRLTIAVSVLPLARLFELGSIVCF